MSEWFNKVSPYPNNLREYLATLHTPDDLLLQELVRETYARTQHPRMLGDPTLCAFMEWLLASSGKKRVLEIGTFTGYTTLRLARVLGEEGVLTTIESNVLHAEIAAKYFAKAQLADRIEMLQGKACDILSTLPTAAFDLVYIDADKAEYPCYLTLVTPLLASGGYLIADNVLWGNKTCDPQVHDSRTEALRAFNRELCHSPYFHSVLIPAGDGILLATKKGEV